MFRSQPLTYRDMIEFQLVKLTRNAEVNHVIIGKQPFRGQRNVLSHDHGRIDASITNYCCIIQKTIFNSIPKPLQRRSSLLLTGVEGTLKIRKKIYGIISNLWLQ